MNYDINCKSREDSPFIVITTVNEFVVYCIAVIQFTQIAINVLYLPIYYMNE